MGLIFENGLVAATLGADTFISDDLIITGDVIYVDSVNGDNANAGTDAEPLETLTQAITNATANNGDVIIIKASHSETLSGSVALNKAGLKIFGLGSGDTRPAFTVAANVDGIAITGADVELNNLRFPASTAAHTSRINVGAAGVKIKNCGFTCGAYDLESITIEDAGDYCTIESCTFTVSANGPDAGIEIESAAVLGLKIKSCSFDGSTFGWDVGGINSAVAHTEFVYIGNTLTNASHIIHSAAAKGWLSGTIAGDNCNIQPTT